MTGIFTKMTQYSYSPDLMLYVYKSVNLTDESRQIVRSMKKNPTDHTGARGMWDIASGYTTNTNPGPTNRYIPIIYHTPFKKIQLKVIINTCNIHHFKVHSTLSKLYFLGFGVDIAKYCFQSFLTAESIVSSQTYNKTKQRTLFYLPSIIVYIFTSVQTVRF